MPIELAGINNVYEFYSEHYLQTVFEGDVQDLFREWREAEKGGATPPNRKLEKAGATWRRLSVEYRAERNDRARLLVFRTFAHEFLDALGYDRTFRLIEDAEEKLLPVTARRSDASGHERVWVIECVSPPGDDFEMSPLALRFRCEQFEGIDDAVDVNRRRKDTGEHALNKGVFALRHPPRFVILLCMSQAVLIDREKWGDSRLMRFEFAEIFGRGDGTTFGAVAALLHATSLAPDSGTALIDRIDEESHRHAHGVSQDLKFALRQAIEMLGNEAAALVVEKRRLQQKGVFTGANALDASVLSTECLRYMYRLLFLLYIEARPDLGFAPINDSAYALGYSLNSLRELEMVPLETEDDRNGHFISDSIDTLFRVVFEGTPAFSTSDGADREVFTFHPVRARLFSPEALGTYLGGLRFRNAVMQEVIALLSLSKEGRGRGRGRISYAQLGISQLGAVYESLLSFTGFFADEDLIELKPADKANPGPLEAAFFAPQGRADEFEKAECVYDGTSPKIFPKGTFIYRLAGRNRENSASFYTPEPLARVLVKYALKELLEGKNADDILKLRIIEPAMGSAAFLVEVVNQLTDKYLELKQAELNRRVPHEDRGDVERRIRAYIADRNVFGVDLNPVAVELGQISLWLNCLHRGGFAPWFDDQVHNGNSLVGARRAVQPVSALAGKRDEDRWYRRKPREIGWSGEKRNDNEIWHFLLPDPGMGAFDQNIVRPLAPEGWDELSRWRREFNQPFDKIEIDNLVRISAAIDILFDDVADRLEEVRRSVNDDLSIWPNEPPADERHVDFPEKIKRLANFHGEGARNAVGWKRLRTAMDAWCALWFWPVEKAALLPARATFISDLALVIEGKMGGDVAVQRPFATGAAQGRLFETAAIPAKSSSGSLFEFRERAAVLERRDLFGDVDVQLLVSASTWLPTAMEVAAKLRFMHFDLEFADVMRERRGFDLVIGNPPWMKPIWADTAVLGESWPEMAIRDVSAADANRMRPSLLASPEQREGYLADYISVAGVQSFVSSSNNFPFAGGGQPNLYKCFADLSFRIVNSTGVAALIHQDSHLTDPNGSDFRAKWYHHIRRHFNFHNVMKSKMFSEINHQTYYSLNIYGAYRSEISFDHASRLFLPHMVDGCYSHDGIGEIPPPKNLDGEYLAVAHRSRVVRIDASVLKTFSAIIEEPEISYDETRFLFPYSKETVAVFAALAKAPSSMRVYLEDFQTSGMFHESGAAKKGIIKRSTQFAQSSSDVISNGPSIYVGNPLYKCADAKASSKGDFEEIDLLLIPSDYLPRCNYIRAVTEVEFHAASPALSWNKNAKHSDLYRIAFRKMLSKPMERTLIAALIPPGVSHVDGIESLACEDERKLIESYPLFLSIVYDFLVKASDHSNFRESHLRSLPYVDVGDTAKHRALRLACITDGYKRLWDTHASSMVVNSWSSDDPRLAAEVSNQHCDSQWTRDVALRSAFSRRLALIEIDVLVSIAFGLTLDQLIEIYRTMFPVLSENENATWYDSCGNIVWTCAKGLANTGFRRQNGSKPSFLEWTEEFSDYSAGMVLECRSEIDFLTDGTKNVNRRFVAPFITCNRELDYRQAWAFFEARSKKKAA